MDGKIIDLQRYAGKGVTLVVTFDNVSSPFMVAVNDTDTKRNLYHRMYDKNRLSLNLPKHGPFVTLINDGNARIKDVLISPIKKLKLNYEFNKKLVVPRNYSIKDIRTVYYPEIIEVIKGVPTVLSTPARFMPALRETQVSKSVIKNFAQPDEEFVLDHEEGHYFYGRPYVPDTIIAKFPIYPHEKAQLSDFYKKQREEDELEADRYALFKFLNKGYNFSGAFNSLDNNLGDDHFSTKRVLSLNNLYNQIKQQYNIQEL